MQDWPQEIYLRAIDCRWPLKYKHNAARTRVLEDLSGVVLHLRVSSLQEMNLVLKRWLKLKAFLEITPWLTRVSQITGLRYQRVSFRGQRRQWGSCSRDGCISLNYKLLLLPEDYVQYVLIHELCHTVHFDHSRAFWQLLSGFIPNWRTLRTAVRCADDYLPRWMQ